MTVTDNLDPDAEKNGSEGAPDLGQANAAADQARSNGTADDKGTPSPREAELQTRLAAADRNRVAAEERVKALERDKLGADEKKDLELKDATEARDLANTRLQEQAIQLAFLQYVTMDSDKKPVVWVNPAAALRLLPRDDIEYGDDGTVKGMDKATASLISDFPFLVQKPSTPSEDEGSTGTGSTGNQPGTNGGGNGNIDDADRQRLEKKYPALRR